LSEKKNRDIIGMNAFSTLHRRENLNIAKNLSIWLSVISLFLWFSFI